MTGVLVNSKYAPFSSFRVRRLQRRLPLSCCAHVESGIKKRRQRRRTRRDEGEKERRSAAQAASRLLSLSFLSLPPLSLPTSPFRALFLQWLFGGGVCLVIFGIMAVMSSCSVAASVACAARLDHIKVRIRLPLYHLTRLVK